MGGHSWEALDQWFSTLFLLRWTFQTNWSQKRELCGLWPEEHRVGVHVQPLDQPPPFTDGETEVKRETTSPPLAGSY